jgi:uncharacterized protein
LQYYKTQKSSFGFCHGEEGDTVPIVLVERELGTSRWKLRAKLAQYVYLYVAPTPSCGLGLFTAKAWRAGSTVLRVEDPHYFAKARPFAQLRARGYTYAEMFQVGADRFIPPYRGLDDFTNHSCEPNCGLRVGPSGFEMIALQDITANEELTYDYSTHQEHSEDHMVCNCASPSCRGIIGSFSTLAPELRRRYIKLGIVAAFAAAEASRAVNG